jgi:integrase
MIHLNPSCIVALTKILPESHPRELVFAWRSGDKCSVLDDYLDKAYARQFVALQNKAGIPEDERFGLHMLRKTHGTILWEQSPGAAQYALGHTSMAITQAHYINGGPMVARALDALEQPWT